MSIRSYVRSTDCHCESRSQNILPCVDISVDACSSTTRAIPTANLKRQLIHHKTAMVTSLTTREKSVDLDQFFTVPFTFILKLTKKFAPSSIANTASQLAVTNHVSNCQVLNSNQIITIDQISSQLVQKIGTSIFDFGVYRSNFKSCFMSVIRAFGFPTQFLLRELKLLIQPIKMPGIAYFQAFASCQQSGDSNVDTNLFFGWWQWLNSRVIYQQRNKPSARRLEFNCNCRRTTTVWQKPRPNYRQWFFALSKPQIPTREPKSRLGKFSRTAIAFGFKPGILGSFPPKARKRFLQMPKTLHERIRVLVASRRWRVSAVRYTTNLIEKVQVFGLFPTGQKTRSFLVLDSFLSFVPSFGSSSQCQIIDFSYTTHCPSQEIFLLGSRKKSISVSSFNHASHFTALDVKNIIRGAHSSHRQHSYGGSLLCENR